MLQQERSSIEVEFEGMAHSLCQMLWLKALLKELGISFEDLIKLFYDNKVVISIAHNSVQHDSNKHVE